MDYFFRPLGKLFEAFFPLIANYASAYNMFVLFVGIVGMAVWVWLMTKFQKDEVPNR